jgi:hypothetical protein
MTWDRDGKDAECCYESKRDCNGICKGKAYTDSCQTCVGGNTGRNETPKDCAGTCNGTAVEVEGVCGAPQSTKRDKEIIETAYGQLDNLRTPYDASNVSLNDRIKNRLIPFDNSLNLRIGEINADTTTATALLDKLTARYNQLNALNEQIDNGRSESGKKYTQAVNTYFNALEKDINLKRELYGIVKNENNTIKNKRSNMKVSYSGDNQNIVYQNEQVLELSTVSVVLFYSYYLLFFLLAFFIYYNKKLVFYSKIFILVILLFYPFFIYTLQVPIYKIVLNTYSYFFRDLSNL